MKDKKENLYFQAVGRRKTAHARVRLTPVKKGEQAGFIVNEVDAEKYFSGEKARALYLEPFRTTNTVGRFHVSVKIIGSGKNSQQEAMIHGVSRALSLADEKYKTILRRRDFLTRDPRAKERKKPGLVGARKGKQSPKR